MNLHTLLRLTLAALIVMTSQTMAVARGAPAPVGTMVICGGQGVYTVSVDAQGQPTGAVHVCPDCALSLFAMDTTGDGAQVFVPAWTTVRAPLHEMAQSSGVVPAATARGPPLPV